MNHTLPPSIIELLKSRKLATNEAHYFVMPHLDMSPYDETVDGVSVIMIVYHTGKILFDSIARVLDDPHVQQFIIIDNGSSERVAEKLRELKDEHDHILLVQGQGNIGFAKAANLGAHLANQPWLVFLNPDAQLRPDCIRRLVQSARGQAGPCIIGSRLLNPDLTEQRGARRGEVTPVTTLLALTKLSKWVPELQKFEIHYEGLDLPDQPQSVPTISGACFCVSKRDFARLKGFDTHFFLHVEDVDLCWRAREAGGTVLFHPKAEVIHEGHTSRVEPMFVELHKGMGLCYYFHKRAKGFWRKAYVLALAPVILTVSFGRALLRPRLRNDEDEVPAE
ncbi:MAG: glycosyltransferase family 2 protein [Asticcacaulis sp.]|nr:glycosyltransferase family 2 protein [Asticcacaulis sp.]